MATFQLGGLPNMQISNAGAPSAAVQAPIQYQQKPNTGVMLAEGLSTVMDGISAYQQRKSETEFQQAFGKAFASDDREAMKSLAETYPTQIEAIRKGMGFIDEEKNQAIGHASMGLGLAAKAGEDAVKLELMKNAELLQSLGVNPEEALAMYQQDPKQFKDYANHVGVFALGVKDYFDLQDKAENRGVTMRGQDLTAETTRRGQDVSAATARRGQDTQASIAAANRAQQARFHSDNMQLKKFDMQIKQASLQDKSIDRQLQTEMNQIKRDELLVKQQAAREKLEQAKADKYDSFAGQMDSMDQTIETANKVLKSDGFTGYFGTNLNPFSNRRIPGTAAANAEALVDTLKSQTFLSNVQQMRGMGALSDAEGKKITDAIGSLSHTMSEKAAKESINNIIAITKKGQSRLMTKHQEEAGKYQQERAQPQGEGFSSLWGD